MSTRSDPVPPSAVRTPELKEITRRNRLVGNRGDLLRIVLTIVGATGLVLGASGFDTTLVFHQFSILKWALLIAAPAGLAATAIVIAEIPGMTSTNAPALSAAAIRRCPGSDSVGIPASETRAIRWPS